MAVPSGSAQVVSQPTSSGRLLRLLSLALPLLSRTPATASAASAASGGATADVCGAHGSGTACASNGGCRTLGTSLALHCPDAASGRLVPQPWFAGWAYQAAFVEKAGRLVRAGNLLRLENALSQAAAESLHAELWSAGGWLRQVRRDPAMQFSRHVLRCDGAIDDGSQSRGASLAAEGGCPPLLQAFHRALREDGTLRGPTVLVAVRRAPPRILEHRSRSRGQRGGHVVSPWRLPIPAQRRARRACAVVHSLPDEELE
eukprot:TRINITY_DN18545_c0_g1_i2.p1 TRINITY_DN18545_c0_g1~~TRINITY_DN18545_c0_g1_i2.p1  ORF type:complete len:279 (+),score=32.08 TRINITY_DN18545_c0_g1_i2:62-838(+)